MKRPFSRVARWSWLALLALILGSLLVSAKPATAAASPGASKDVLEIWCDQAIEPWACATSSRASEDVLESYSVPAYAGPPDAHRPWTTKMRIALMVGMTTITAPSFADVLRELRKKAGLSQRELAQKIGINHSLLSLIEAKRRNPPTQKAVYQKLQEITDIGEAGVKRLLATPDAPDLLRTATGQRALTAMNNASPATRLQITLPLDVYDTQLSDEQIQRIAAIIQGTAEDLLKRYVEGLIAAANRATSTMS